MPTRTDPSFARLNLDALSSRDPATAAAIASAPVSPVEPTAAEASYERSLDYRTEVPCVYRAARVTVNVGSFNAPSALNMRAHDVPAVGGCLLTDARPGLDRSFDPGREIVAYDDPAEIPGLVRGLLEDPVRRDGIARAGSHRVRRDHSFDCRWPTIIDACRVRSRSSA